MKKIVLISSVLLFILSNITLGQINFDPAFYFKSGYENNIFRSPDILELTDGTILNENDLILNDYFIDLGYDLYAKYKFKKKHKIRISHDLWNRIYSENKSLNQFKLNAKFNYDYKLNKKMHIGFIYRFDKVNKIGTSILGTELTQLFSYNKNYAELHYKYNYMRFSGVQIGVSYYKKVFERAVDIIPLDYTNLAFSLRIGQQFHIQKIIFKAILNIDYSEKNFTDKIALTATGDELISNPFRLWKYYSGMISLKGQTSPGFSFKPYIKYKIRDDMFEDYYSYNLFSSGIKLSYENDRFEAGIGPVYKNLNYQVKTAPDPGSIEDPELRYTYFNTDLYFKVKIYKGVYLSTEFRNKMRDSNTLDLGRKTRRPYKYFELSGSIFIKPFEFR